MPRISGLPIVINEKDWLFVFAENDEQAAEAINREAGAQDTQRRNQPLAQGKPAGGRSKGKPTRGRRAPRKGSGAK